MAYVCSKTPYASYCYALGCKAAMAGEHNLDITTRSVCCTSLLLGACMSHSADP